MGWESGFSLVEILISLAIMALALLALVSVLTGGMKAQDKTSKHALAHAVAEQTLDRVAATLRADTEDAHEEFWEGSSWSLPANLAECEVDGTRFRSSLSSTAILASGQELGTLSGDAHNVARWVTLTVAWSEDSVKSGVGEQQISVGRVLSRSQR